MTKLHADEVDLAEALVRALVDRQFPQWANLPLWPRRHLEAVLGDSTSA
jgi:hypothetical protein